jgi:UDP-glucose 4-epimerase
MQILVSGGAGYIGSFTVRALVERGYRVQVIDDLSTGHAEALPSGVTLHRGDIGHAQFLDKLLSSDTFDAAIHFAAKASVPDSIARPWLYFEENTGGSLTFFQALSKNGVNKIVFSSTAATYGTPSCDLDEEHPQRPINPYGASKLAAENILRGLASSGTIRSVALRYFNACGAAGDGKIGEDHKPETHLLPNVIAAALGVHQELELFGVDYPTPDGSCIRDYIHVEDLGAAHILSLEGLFQEEKNNQPFRFNYYNCSTGCGTSNKEIISAVEKLLGCKVPVKISPRRPGDPAILVAKPDKLIKELNWQPKYTSIESIAKTVIDWMEKKPGGYSS